MAAQETMVSSGSKITPSMFDEAFWPAEPRTIEETGLTDSLIESLVCQVLQLSGTASGQRIAERVGLPFAIIEQMLGTLRTRQLVVHARPAAFNDYYYSLTENGRARAQQLQKTSRGAQAGCPIHTGARQASPPTVVLEEPRAGGDGDGSVPQHQQCQLCQQ